MKPGRSPRGRRVPNWVLGAVVAAVLSGSVALFVVDATQDDPRRAAATDRSDTGDDGELLLPDGEGTDDSDSRRRSELGRDRSAADGDDATEEDGAGDDAASANPVILDGKTIALVPADATAVNGSDASKLQRIGTIRVPCAPSGAPAELARQREILDALAVRLRSAGARVVRVDDARGAVPCAGDRSAAFERADLTLVVATGEDSPNAIVARAVGKPTTADTSRARRLVDALGSEVGVDVVASASSPRVVDLLDEHGVVDRPGGGTVAWLSLGAASSKLEPERLAGSMLAALAQALTPPGAKPPPRAATPGTTTRPAATIPRIPTPALPTTTPSTPAPAVTQPATTTPTATTPKPTTTPATPKPTTPTTTTPTTTAPPTTGSSSGPDSDD